MIRTWLAKRAPIPLIWCVRVNLYMLCQCNTKGSSQAFKELLSFFPAPKSLFNSRLVLTCVYDSGSDVAPQLEQALCSTKVMANFRCGTQCRASHMSSSAEGATCAWMRTSIFSKHSAASSMQPNWKRFWSKNVEANALRRASGGRAVSVDDWSCEKSSWNKKKRLLYKLELAKIQTRSDYIKYWTKFNAIMDK